MTQGLNGTVALIAILLIIIAAAAFILTDGGLRIAVGAACIVGLLVCVRQLARTRADHRRLR